MSRLIRMRGGETYGGATALEIVREMQGREFGGDVHADDVRQYMARAIARASIYFGLTMQTDPRRGTEEEAAEKFIDEAIRHGLAEEVTTQ